MYLIWLYMMRQWGWDQNGNGNTSLEAATQRQI